MDTTFNSSLTSNNTIYNTSDTLLGSYNTCITTSDRSYNTYVTSPNDGLMESASKLDMNLNTSAPNHTICNTSNELKLGATMSNEEGVFEATVSIDTVYVIIGSIGLLGNLFVMVIILNGRTMLKKITNLYILNQSILDFGASFFLISTSFGSGISPDGSNPTFAEFICRFWTAKYPLWALLVSSTYNLLLITMERYMEVVHPIRHKVSFSRRLAYVTIVLVWLIGPLWQTYFFATSRLVKGQCVVFSEWPSEALRQAFGTLNVCVQFLFPFCVLIYVYSRIIYVITHRIHAVNQPLPNTSKATTQVGNFNITILKHV